MKYINGNYSSKNELFYDISGSFLSHSPRRPSQDLITPPQIGPKSEIEPNGSGRQGDNQTTEQEQSKPAQNNPESLADLTTSLGTVDQARSNSALAQAGPDGIEPDHSAPDCNNSSSQQQLHSLEMNQLAQLGDLTQLNGLSLTDSPRRKKITREDFKSSTGNLETNFDPADPLSQLNPLWNLK